MKFNNSPFIKNVMRLMSGSILAQLITVISLPLVTRIYSPEEMGVMNLIISFMVIWGAVACLRYDSAVFLASSKQEAVDLILLSFLISTLLGIISYPVLHGLKENVLFGFEMISKEAIFWSAIVALLSGWYAAIRAYSLREEYYGLISKSVIVKSLVQALGRLSLGFAGLGVLGLVLSEMLAAVATVLMLMSTMRNMLSEAMARGVSDIYKGMLRVAVNFKKFPQFEFPSVLVDQLALNAPIPMIAALYGPKEAGIYGTSRLLLAFPVAQFGRAVGDVTQSRISELIRKGDKENVQLLFKRLTRKLFVIGVLPMFVVIILAPPYLWRLLGSGWENSGEVVAIIAPWMLGSLVVGSLSRIILSLQRQGLKLAYDFLSLTLVLFVTLLAWRFDIVFLGLVGLFSVAGVIGYIFYWHLLSHAVNSMNKG